MGKKLAVLAGAVATLVAGSVLAFAAPAHATTKASAVAVPAACAVIPLPNGLQITLCI